LELQGNDNKCATESYVKIEVETEAQNKKIVPETISKTPDGTTATISIAQNLKCLERLPGKDLRSRQRK